MKPHINLMFSDSVSSQLHEGEKISYCRYPTKFSNVNLTDIEDAVIVTQTHSDELTNIQLFEITAYQDIEASIDMRNAGACMLIMLEGNLKLTTATNDLTFKVKGTCCCLSQSKQGNYGLTVAAGLNAFMVVSLNASWLIAQSEIWPQLSGIVNNLLRPRMPVLILPQCPVNKGIKKCVKRLQRHYVKDAGKKTIIVTTFLWEILTAYNRLLEEHRYIKCSHNQDKAEALKRIIHEEYPQPSITDEFAMADRLNVSRKNLKLLAQFALHVPLDEYVATYRLNRAMRLIIESDDALELIAKKVGYAKLRSFSFDFELRYGVLPGAILRYPASLFIEEPVV